MSVTTIFLVVAVYWATGMAGGTAWNAWAGTLVPERIRAPYFAWRTRFTQLGIMLGLAAGGIILQLGQGMGLAHPCLCGALPGGDGEPDILGLFPQPATRANAPQPTAIATAGRAARGGPPEYGQPGDPLHVGRPGGLPNRRALFQPLHVGAAQTVLRALSDSDLHALRRPGRLPARLGTRGRSPRALIGCSGSADCWSPRCRSCGMSRTRSPISWPCKPMPA